MLYLDSARDRLDADFRSSVEAARMGTVFASNANAYQSWSRRTSVPEGSGLTGKALEVAIMNIAREFPVIRGPL
jgi:hypothetical protein